MIASIEEARMTLDEAAMDVAADHGDAGVEAGWVDIVRAVADLCTPEVAKELLRREGLQP